MDDNVSEEAAEESEESERVESHDKERFIGADIEAQGASRTANKKRSSERKRDGELGITSGLK